MLIYTWLHPMSTPTVYPAQSTLLYFMWQHHLTYVTLHLATPSTVYVLLLHVTQLNGLEISSSPSSTSCDSLWHLSHRSYSLTLRLRPISDIFSTSIVTQRSWNLFFSFFYVMWQPLTPFSSFLQPHLTHWPCLRPISVIFSTSTASPRLQLPNTSLKGGNVCLATLPSSDRDYNSSTTSTWNSHLHLHFSYMQWTSCTFKWLFREHSSHSDLPFHSKHFACAVNIVNIQMTSATFVNIFANTSFEHFFAHYLMRLSTQLLFNSTHWNWQISEHASPHLFSWVYYFLWTFLQTLCNKLAWTFLWTFIQAAYFATKKHWLSTFREHFCKHLSNSLLNLSIV
jgi:hypothetical protein